ncbi:MAG TPA: arylesterase, partial [Polyangiales bacterium]|nr:arylesterase [Polyangiales bacterium]
MKGPHCSPQITRAQPSKPGALRCSLVLASALTAIVACGCGSPEIRSSAPLPATPAPPVERAPAQAGLPKVIFLGDSISAGLHLAEDQAFPAVLEHRLRARGAPFELVNAGVSGDTTAGGVSRLAWLLRQAPDIIAVELGANDAMRGIDPALVEQNLRTIVERIRAAGVTPLLLGMRIPPSYGAEHAEAIDALYDRIAADLKVAYVP